MGIFACETMFWKGAHKVGVRSGASGAVLVRMAELTTRRFHPVRTAAAMMTTIEELPTFSASSVQLTVQAP